VDYDLSIPIAKSRKVGLLASILACAVQSLKAPLKRTFGPLASTLYEETGMVACLFEVGALLRTERACERQPALGKCSKARQSAGFWTRIASSSDVASQRVPRSCLCL